MAKGGERAEEYHRAFAERIIRAPEAGTAPWQKPWQPGERILPHNFGSGRDYRGGNAVYLAVEALEKGYAEPRWGGYHQLPPDRRRPAATCGRARRGATRTRRCTSWATPPGTPAG